MIERLRKRPLLAITAIAGFLFSAVAEARGAEPCPYHDGLPAAVALEGQAETEPSGTEAADHGEHSAVAEERGAPSGHDAAGSSHGSSDHGACSCLGDCNVGGAATLPNRPAAAELSVGVGFTATAIPSQESLFSHKSGGLWLLYLPTAPPLSL